MARGFTATLEVKCWKEHACCYCGAAYRYRLDKKQSASGATQADAVSAARAAAERGLRGTIRMFPCPACGHYQPDMIAGRRLRRHAVVLVAAVALWLLLFLLAETTALPASAALWLLVFGAVPTFLAYTWYGAANPNRGIRANKVAAERLVQERQLELVSGESEREDRPRPVVIEVGSGFVAVCGLLVITLLLMPGAEMVRLAGNWPSNPGWHPPTFGPGDTAWTWLEPAQAVQTRGGEWRFLGGSASVTLADGKEKIPLGVSSRDEPLREVGAHESLRPARIWVRLQFPKNPRLRSKDKTRIEVTLNLAVPAAEGPDRETRQEVTATVEANLARPRAAFLYGFFWNVALFGGGAMFLLAGMYHLLCDAALKRTAPTTKVTALTEDGSAAAATTSPLAS